MERTKSLWVVVQGVFVVAICSCLGWVLVEVNELGKAHSAEEAEDQLRSQVTDVVNDIDRRLAVMETHLEWLRAASGGRLEYQPDSTDPAPPVPMGMLEEEPFFGPKYDLRQGQQQQQQQQQQQTRD